MKNDKAFEALLEAALRRRGAPAPFAIDVRARVMARVAVIGPPPRKELDSRQLWRWAAAASLAGLALIGAAFWAGPSLSAVAASLGHAMAGGTDAMLKLWVPAASLAGKLGGVVLALYGSAQSVVRPLAAFQPFAHALLAAIAAFMLGITAVIVGRDVSTRVATKEHA
jgi:hypothetical protein